MKATATLLSNKFGVRSYWEARLRQINRALRLLPHDESMSDTSKELFKRDLLRDKAVAERNFNATW